MTRQPPSPSVVNWKFSTDKDKMAPQGWVIDQAGNFLIDSNACLDGFGEGTAALLPLGGLGETLGGHKGYGLATIVEILSASLQTGSFLYGLIGLDDQGKAQPNCLGHFFMAMNIESFTSLEAFKKTTGEILRELRAATLQPGCERIYTAGEKEYEIEKRVRAGRGKHRPQPSQRCLRNDRRIGPARIRSIFFIKINPIASSVSLGFLWLIRVCSTKPRQTWTTPISRIGLLTIESQRTVLIPFQFKCMLYNFWARRDA